jgi:uncharacterized protein YndB with AHSA1/START domain
MINIELSVQIDRPCERVFEYLTNVGNLPEWQNGVIQSKGLTEGPVSIGFRFEEQAKVGP